MSILQFLDLMKEVRDIAEIDGTELTDRLIGYIPPEEDIKKIERRVASEEKKLAQDSGFSQK